MTRAARLAELILVWAVMLAAGLAVASWLVAVPWPAWAHDPYTGWKDRRGYGCCDNTDCRPTRAYVGEDGRWRAMVDGAWMIVPPDVVLAVPSPDGRSHVCHSPGALEPRCFVPGEPRS